MNECVRCKKELKRTEYPSFTGTCNFGAGHRIYFYFCNNKKCDRYLLYVGHTIREE